MRKFLGNLCRRLGVAAPQQHRLMRDMRAGVVPDIGGDAHALTSGLAEMQVEVLHENGEALLALADCYRAQLEASDYAMARVVEDLINLLVERGAIDFCELPPATQSLLNERALLRAELEAIMKFK